MVKKVKKKKKKEFSSGQISLLNTTQPPRVEKVHLLNKSLMLTRETTCLCFHYYETKMEIKTDEK